MSSADVAQAQSQYKSTQASLLEARITRAQYEHALAALLGKAPANFSLPVTGHLPTPPAVPGCWPPPCWRRPDICCCRAPRGYGQCADRRGACGPFPLADPVGIGRLSQPVLSDLLNAPNLFWSLGPALAMSLFDGGARSAAVESARATLDLNAAPTSRPC